MNERYIEPTAATRAKLLGAVAAVIVVGWAYEKWVSPQVEWVANLPTCEALPWVRLELIAGLLMCWYIGYAALRHGRRILATGQTPLPSAWVWYRTRIRTGLYAKFTGYFSIVTGAIFLLGPVVVIASQELYVIFCLPQACGCS